MNPRTEKIIRYEPANIAGRVPPHDLDAEAAVLSAVLLERDALDRVIDLLRPEHFYSHANGRIYEAAESLSRAGKPVDVTTIAGWLRDRDWMGQIGGPSYLAQLADATPAVAHVTAHGQVVFEKWRLRQLIATCQRISAEGYADVGVIQEFIDAAEGSVFEVARGGIVQDSETRLDVALHAAFTEIEDAAKRGTRITGIATGYEQLDERTSGLHEGDLWWIAARPGRGKTAIATSIGVNVAAPRRQVVQDDDNQWRQTDREVLGDGVQIFSLEMPRKQLALRMACTEARIDILRARLGRITPQDWNALAASGSFLSALPLWVDDTPGLTLFGMRAKVRRRKAECARKGITLRLIILDYFQLMKGRRGARSREEELAEVSRGLKELAKEMHVAVIVLAQLNRDVEKRGKNARPQLSDIRETGQAEQDADLILFIHREELTDPKNEKWKGIAELIIGKQRNGPTGTIHARFTSFCARFDNLAPGEYEGMVDE